MGFGLAILSWVGRLMRSPPPEAHVKLLEQSFQEVAGSGSMSGCACVRTDWGHPG